MLTSEHDPFSDEAFWKHLLTGLYALPFMVLALAYIIAQQSVLMVGRALVWPFWVAGRSYCRFIEREKRKETEGREVDRKVNPRH